MHSKNYKTVHIIGGISGLQAYSTHVVTSAIFEELVKLGWDCKLLVLDPAVKPKHILLRWLSEAVHRHVIYPIWCRANTPKHALVYVTDHANAGVLKFLKKPNQCIIHVHDVISLRPISKYPYRVRWRNYLIWIISRYTKKRGVEAADHIIAISKITEKEILLYLAVQKQNITTAHNGINHDIFFPENKLEARNKLTLPHDAFIIISLGVASYRKNYSIIAKALNNISSTSKQIIWIHIGKIDRDSTSIINNFKHIRFINIAKVTDTELRKYYSSASLYISSSLHEGFGLPPVEALACGTNVAVSRIPAHIEVLPATTLFFDPNDYNDLKLLIENIINNKCHMNRIDENTNIAKKYNWEKTGMIVDNVLKQFCR